MTAIERTGKNVHIKFSSDKFNIEIRALGDEQSLHLTEILRAKQALYCVDELLSEVDAGTAFRTKTFGTLLVLNERDQYKWVVSHLDELFEAAATDEDTSSRRSSPFMLVSAARMVIEGNHSHINSLISFMIQAVD